MHTLIAPSFTSLPMFILNLGTTMRTSISNSFANFPMSLSGVGRLHAVILVTVALFVLPSGARAQDREYEPPRLTPGVPYTIKVTEDITTKSSENEPAINVKTTSWEQWTPEKKSDDEMIIKVKYQRFILEIDTGTVKQRYDSEVESDQGDTPLATIGKAFRRAEFILTLDAKKLKVVKIRVPEQILSLPNVPTESAQAAGYDSYFSAMPTAKFKKGSTWKRGFAYDTNGAQINRNMDVTATETNGDQHTIGFTGEADVTGVPQLGSAIENPRFRDIKITGAAKYDSRIGMITEFEQKSTIALDFRMKVGLFTKKDVSTTTTIKKSMVLMDYAPKESVDIGRVTVNQATVEKEGKVDVVESEVGGETTYSKSRTLRREISYSVKVGLSAEAEAKLGASIVAARAELTARIKASIEAEKVDKWTDEITETATHKINLDKNPKVKVIWYDVYRTGTIEVKLDGKTHTIPFEFPIATRTVLKAVK
jgi:hypothetical protein